MEHFPKKKSPARFSFSCYKLGKQSVNFVTLQCKTGCQTVRIVPWQCGQGSRKKVLNWQMRPDFCLNWSKFDKYFSITKTVCRRVAISWLLDTRPDGKQSIGSVANDPEETPHLANGAGFLPRSFAIDT